MASRNIDNASPAVTLPARSTTDTLSTLLVVRLKSMSISVFGLGHALHDRLEDRIRIYALGFTFEIQNHSMAQSRHHNRPNIAGRHFLATVQECANFAAHHKGLGAPWACAIFEVLFRHRMRKLR